VVLKKVTIVPEGAPMPPLPGAAAPQGSQPRAVNISSGVAAGLIESHTVPIYPPDARKAGISGMVVLQAAIGADGLVKNIAVVSGPSALQQAAIDAVKTWRYRPYLLNGQAVEVKTTVNVIFTLGSTH